MRCNFIPGQILTSAISPFILTLLLPKEGSSSPHPIGFSSITFERNKLQASNFAQSNFNNVHIKLSSESSPKFGRGEV